MARERKPRKKIDWEWIEGPFRAGIKSVLQIAAEYYAETGVTVTHAGIAAHFKKLGITRNLASKVKSKADALVSIAEVLARVSTETTITDAVIINESAQAVADVRMSHRRDIRRGISLLMRLFDELEIQTSNIELFEQLGDILANPDERGQDKLNDIYRKCTALPGRVDSVKKLTDAMKTLVTLQREAYNITPANSPTPEEEAAQAGAAVPGKKVQLPDHVLALIPIMSMQDQS